MRSALTKISAASLAATSSVTSAFAALNNPPDIPGLSNNADIKQTIVGLIATVLDYILLVAVIFVIVAGIRLIVSSGDEGEKDKAKKTIIYVIVGIVVILLARVLVLFVSNLLG